MLVWEYTLTAIGLRKLVLNNQETLEIMYIQKKKKNLKLSGVLDFVEYPCIKITFTFSGTIGSSTLDQI